MKYFSSFIFLSILFINAFSKFTKEQRHLFLQKLTDKISPEKISKDFNTIKNEIVRDEGEDQHHGIEYNKTIIDQIIEKYNFPRTFNYLEENGIEPIVKNQKSCGCCWSHSATTALSYRFKKAYNIDVNLSPQDGLSCYIRDCDLGNSILDAQLNLIRNGTLTEGCFPFTSDDGQTIPKCPTECEDGSDFIKYKAKNAYMTRDYYSEATFYDIVALIMDQLETYGPVISAITCYEDFRDHRHDGGDCKNYIYKYDGEAENAGGHAVTIVGYGFEGDRYYWLVQNSWGKTYCDNGFIKVEFGQIGIEQVSFAEAYLPSDQATPNVIDLSLESIHEKCLLNINDLSQSQNWNNSFEVNFEKVDNNKEIIKFICGKVKNQDDEVSLNCLTEELKFHQMGEYKFKNLSSLGTENNFIAESSFEDKKFSFYSWDHLYPSFVDYQYYYISEKGSKIIFYYEKYGNYKNIPKIYSDANNNKNLKNCKQFTFFFENFISCEIDSDELEYFDYLNQPSDKPILYTSYCGYKFSADTFVYRLNKSENPVFRVKSARMDNIEKITAETEIRVTVGVEGSISNFNQTQEFLIFGYIQRDIKSEVIFYCNATRPESVGKDHVIICTPNIREGEFGFIRAYFYPYVIPIENYFPYEIIINKEIKVLKGDETEFGNYLKISKILILSLLILF